MLELAVACFAVVAVVWAVLLYRFHVALVAVDPELAGRAGKPSLFFAAFNGHVGRVQWINRRDLATGRYASLAPQAGRLRMAAWAMIACLLWIGAASLRGFPLD